MPIVVRPEDIRLSKRKLKKTFYTVLGLRKGNSWGFKRGKRLGALSNILTEKVEISVIWRIFIV